MAEELKPELQYILLKGLLSEIDVCIYHLPHLHFDWGFKKEEIEDQPNDHIVSKKMEEGREKPVIVNHIVS